MSPQSEYRSVNNIKYNGAVFMVDRSKA